MSLGQLGKSLTQAITLVVGLCKLLAKTDDLDILLFSSLWKSFVQTDGGHGQATACSHLVFNQIKSRRLLRSRLRSGKLVQRHESKVGLSSDPTVQSSNDSLTFRVFSLFCKIHGSVSIYILGVSNLTVGNQDHVDDRNRAWSPAGQVVDWKHTTGVSLLGSLWVSHKQLANDIARSLVTTGVVKRVHSLVINALDTVGVSIDQSKNDSGGRLTSASTVNGEEAPHDFLGGIALVFIVANDPSLGFSGALLGAGNGNIPGARGDRLIQLGDVLVKVNLQIRRNECSLSHGGHLRFPMAI
mmetsp:Transcript_42796/g.103525  ORF Transcript_42796/g.103525 Transcript_42796/m.103525 type:complete len:299 (-) Transcript_42796:11-907(-)